LTFAVLLQMETPVEQSVTPVWQALPLGVHGVFALQGKQLPLLQTRSIPQFLPLGWLAC
jgi:hypothetical protein